MPLEAEAALVMAGVAMDVVVESPHAATLVHDVPDLVGLACPEAADAAAVFQLLPGRERRYGPWRRAGRSNRSPVRCCRWESRGRAPTPAARAAAASRHQAFYHGDVASLRQTRLRLESSPAGALNALTEVKVCHPCLGHLVVGSWPATDLRAADGIMERLVGVTLTEWLPTRTASSTEGCAGECSARRQLRSSSKATDRPRSSPSWATRHPIPAGPSAWSGSRRMARSCSSPAKRPGRSSARCCFPYMDFSTIEKRRAACAREVEMNRRLAPESIWA